MAGSSRCNYSIVPSECASIIIGFLVSCVNYYYMWPVPHSLLFSLLSIEQVSLFVDMFHLVYFYSS